MTLLAYEGKRPVLGKDVFVADNATVIGDVVLGDRSSVWYGTVIRADVEKVRIGAESNVQDNSVIHVDSSGFGVTIGERVLIGHRVVLHGCRIGDGALIGIGAVLLNGSDIGEEAMIGAGSLVPPGMKIPPGVLALGSPARIKRPLTDEERNMIRDGVRRYVGYAKVHGGIR